MEKVVVKGQADLPWTKVERKRTFDRLKQEKKKEMDMIKIRDNFHLKGSLPCRFEGPCKMWVP